ncbi:MAG: GNAT family N-acetyltransferase [Sphingomonadaceae bacterium]|jgi:GNAT superfamily N-acetyltransferase
MTEILIREATREDAALIYGFICALADYEKLRDQVKATPEGIAGLLFGPRPYAEVLIAEARGEAVGFALYFHNFSTFEGKPGIYLEDLYVEPHARGLGAGKALFARLAEIAIERDCARLEWSVLDWNAPSIAFYEALGARAMDEWTIYRLDGSALGKLASAAENQADS